MYDALPCPIAERGRATPEAPALVDAAGTLSYRALDRMIAGVEAAMAAEGVGAGDRVATIGPADRHAIAAFWAAMRRRAVVCPLSDRLPAAAIDARIDELGIGFLLAADGTTRAGARPIPWRAGDAFASDDGEERPAAFDLDAPAAALFTSGSTGRPRAALLRFGQLYFNALGASQNMPLGAGDRWLLALPLYHVSGIGVLFRTFLAGSSLGVLPSSTPLEERLGQGDITHLSLVPAQLIRLLDAGVMPGALRAVLLGGSQVPSGLLERALERGWPIHTTYGLTEMGSQVTTTRAGAGLAELRSSGALLPYRELRIDGAGEIHVRGKTLFAGYLTADGLQQPFDEAGWYATGDLGRLDEQGLLHVRGRRDNLFISGGENIQPEEIEQALVRCAGVLRALVVPVPDAVYGQRPFAFVETGPAYGGEDALLRQLAEGLPRFKLPVGIAPWPADAPAGLKPPRPWFAERAASTLRTSPSRRRVASSGSAPPLEEGPG
ncbi:MAG: o-succinylbenzoate--CoA ligase [Rhodothermales bacterium]